MAQAIPRTGELRPTPRSYDEIVRRTVPEPDSSFRPTRNQENDALAHLEQRPDRTLYLRLSEVLLDDHSLGDIGFELEHGRVTLNGIVHNPRAITYLEDLARAIDGVDEVINRIVVARGDEFAGRSYLR